MKDNSSNTDFETNIKDIILLILFFFSGLRLALTDETIFECYYLSGAYQLLGHFKQTRELIDIKLFSLYNYLIAFDIKTSLPLDSLCI